MCTSTATPSIDVCFVIGCWSHQMELGFILGPTLRIKVFRAKMHMVPSKDIVKLDAWTCKSMLSFVKMKTHKKLGSVVARLILYMLFLGWYCIFNDMYFHPWANYRASQNISRVFPHVSLCSTIYRFLCYA